uniref:DUF1289 domain-containing protein n=1 Tax=Pseudomonas sp. TMP9 TaxID=3133144 RepID=UPI00403F2127
MTKPASAGCVTAATNSWVKCWRALPWSNPVPTLSLKSSDAAGETIVSPCRRQCCLDDQDICLGCGRTLQDILDWSKADQPRQRAICTAAEARLQQRNQVP